LDVKAFSAPDSIDARYFSGKAMDEQGTRAAIPQENHAISHR
jgi:hypothetical protein